MKLIDGNKISAEIRAGIARDVAIWKAEHAITPSLAVVLVGDDPASHLYVRNKTRQTAAVGMKSFEHFVDGDVSLSELLDLIQRLNEDEGVHGILVQLPLPSQLEAEAVLDAITPEKDVDGFHFTNAGLLAMGRDALVPCTPQGCMHLLRSVHPDLTGMNAVVVGRSNIVGKPMAQLLLQADCSVTIAHSRSRDLASICRTADILVAAVGRPGLIKQDWVKPGATVLDVGINRVIGEDDRARLTGDVDFEPVSRIAGAITPVPGGVGPMTIACLLANTLTACRRMTLGLQD